MVFTDFKKGTARIALSAWKQSAIEQSFRVLPVGLNYNVFRQFRKRIIIHFGKAITKQDLPALITEGETIQYFNQLLTERLKTGILQSNEDSHIVQLLLSNYTVAGITPDNLMASLKRKQQQAEEQQLLPIVQSIKLPGLIAIDTARCILNVLGIVLLFVPALLGCISHAGLYGPLKSVINKKTQGSVFYDSVMFGALLLVYPFYWILISAIVLLLFDYWYIKIFLLLLPAWGWIYMIWKDCLQRIINYFFIFPAAQ